MAQDARRFIWSFSDAKCEMLDVGWASDSSKLHLQRSTAEKSFCADPPTSSTLHPKCQTLLAPQALLRRFTGLKRAKKTMTHFDGSDKPRLPKKFEVCSTVLEEYRSS